MIQTWSTLLKSIHWASEISDLALRYGGRPAVFDTDGTTSHADLFAKAAGVGHALMAVGIGPGDAVATLFRNGADAVAATFGVMMAGAVEVPVNPALSADERAYCFAVADVRLLVTSAGLAKDISADRPAVLTIEGIKPAALDSASFPFVDGNAPARIVFTSGTTGRPKGAVHSQNGRWTANILLRANLPFRPGADSNVLLMTPFSHGSSLMTHAYLSSGASVTLLDGVNPPTVLGILDRGECDAMFAPPTVLAKIVAAAGEQRFSSLRTIFCGTAVLKPTLYARARELFGPIVRVTYGKSEVFNPITVLEAEETEAWYASGGDDACVGWPAPGVEIVIRGEDGEPVTTGDSGEVLIRAQHLMTGYRTAEGFSPLAPNEFHDTGDLGYVDGKGRLHLTGRSADVIKSGGYKVAPEEVERLLAPALQPSEVAVVGIPSDYWGEVILAAVENPAPGWEERIDTVVRTLTDYKRPRLLIAMDELPRNGIGKILRSAIRADVLSRFHLTEGPRPRLEKRD
jgi:acyl-CoA synthetase (AMP-forming)/AMP-acid ligase II